MSEEKNIHNEYNEKPESGNNTNSGAGSLKKKISDDLSNSMKSYATRHPGSFQKPHKKSDYTHFIQDYVDNNTNLIS